MATLVNAAGAAPRCVLFAMRHESRFFRRIVRPFRRVTGAPCCAELCGNPDDPILVLETGVGRAAVTTAFDWLFAAHLPRRVLFAGFAGALDHTLAVGDVVRADAVVDEHGHAWPTAPDTTALRHGRLLTSDRLIASPVDKKRLGILHGAIAVDMEAAHAAAFCARHCIPFNSVRAISDTVDTHLSPAVLGLLAGGQVAPTRVLTAIARKPALVPELWRLGRDTRRAAQQLARVLGGIV